jgi:hypothetical protein
MDNLVYNFIVFILVCDKWRLENYEKFIYYFNFRIIFKSSGWLIFRQSNVESSNNCKMILTPEVLIRRD